MNKLRFVSDLHLELSGLSKQPKLSGLYSLPNSNDKYYLALLGDIGNLYKPELKQFLEKVSPLYKKVYFIPGNHEYYNLDKNNIKNVETIKNRLETLCNSFTNVIFLDNKVDYIDDFKIIGSTLWSHVDNDHSEYIEKTINDYYLIYTDDKKITVNDTNKWNKESVDFIKREIETLNPCIVLTHHSPLFSNPKLNQYTANPFYFGKDNNQAFHNDLGYLIKSPIECWLYGHTHYCSEFLYNDVLIKTNQLGYKNQQEMINFNALEEIILDVNLIKF